MKTHHMTSPTFVDRVRQAASESLLVRSALIATLGISVTVGGVLAGALVVAPVVAHASKPGSASVAMRTIGALGTAAMSASREIAARGGAVVTETMTTLPQPMTRYALFALGLVAIVAAIAPKLFARRTPMRSLVPESAEGGDFTGSLAAISTASTAAFSGRMTPRSSARIGAKRNQTPRAVEALAASGASPSDIAWKTGLPIDAVRLLLAISTGTRQLQPPAA